MGLCVNFPGSNRRLGILVEKSGLQIHSIYSKITIGTYCYTAQETAQELLYQHTNYNETIVLQAVPIYYLEPNTRISVYNQKAGIYGDYVIKSISLPVDAGSVMTINAIRARERI